ncbi:energy transducer TonB [Rheinheimera riviphila]|nr:energy transducer TonB [Rheinheimera riviphila]
MFRKLLLTVLVLHHTAAYANFLTGLQAYEKKDYATAQYEFSALLPIANEQAAFNLAAMAINGEGQATDKVKALAYFELAVALGHPEAATMVTKIKPKLSAAQSAAATALLAKLTQGVMINKNLPDENPVELEAIKRVSPEYPEDAARNGWFGYVTIRYMVDEQGAVIAVDTLDSFPEKVFERAAMKAVKRWRYQPTGKKQLGTVKMTFTMGPLQQHAMQKWLKQYNVWSYAIAGSPQHQEALGSLLHLVNNNSGLILEENEAATFNAEALPVELFREKAGIRSQVIEHFHGYAKVEVNDQGVVTKILEAKHQQARSAKDILLNKPLPKADTAGIYSLTSQLDNKVVINKVLAINPLYSYYYWWKTAAKNGDLRAQRFLAAHDKEWENYLLTKDDPQVQTWVGARMILDGDTANGKALLAKAREQNYALAQELTDTL